MPYFPILQKPTQNNLITKTSFRQDAPPRRDASLCEKTAEERIAPSARRIAIAKKPPKSGFINVTLGCPLVAMHRHRRKTAEERFNMLARGWLAYPVTPTHHTSTAEERLYKRHPSVCKSNDSNTNAISLQITYTTALRR